MDRYPLTYVIDLPQAQALSAPNFYSVIDSALAGIDIEPEVIICRVNGHEVTRFDWPPPNFTSVTWSKKKHRRAKKQGDLDTRKQDIERVVAYLRLRTYPLRERCPVGMEHLPHLTKVAAHLRLPRHFIGQAYHQLLKEGFWAAPSSQVTSQNE